MSVQIRHHEFSHSIVGVLRRIFYFGAPLLHLVKVVIDFVAKHAGNAPSNWLRILAGAVLRQMQRHIAECHTSVVTNAKLFRKPKHISVVLQRRIEICHLENGSDMVCMHFG